SRTRIAERRERRTARTAEPRGQPNRADSRTARTAEPRGQPNGAHSRRARTANCANHLVVALFAPPGVRAFRLSALFGCPPRSAVCAVRLSAPFAVRAVSR